MRCAGTRRSTRPGRVASAARYLVVATVAMLGAQAARAERTDVIVLVNGDSITGEIKQLDRGLLRYKTDSAGTLQVEWEDVVTLSSEDSFEVETTSGGRFFGSLEALVRDAPSVVVGDGEERTELYLENVVRINPIHSGFFRRIDGSLSLGFDYTQASDVGKFNFGFNADYRVRKFVSGVALSSNVTTQSDQPNSERYDANYYYERFRLNRWFTRWSGSLQSNDEIGLALRTQASWIGGRYMKQTSTSLLSTGAGFAVSRELRTGESEDQNNIDLVLTTDYQFFRYHYPKRDLSVALFVYPSLTTWGRVRGDFDARLRFELFADFFLEISFYGTYDNDAPEDALSSTDYGVVTSLSWTF
jgi:hypothetical protein